MTNRKPIKKLQVNIERFNYYVSALFNCGIVLSSLMFMVYLIAPLLGGKWLPKALIVYASWVGWALIGKFVWGRVYKKIRLKTYEFVLVCSYGVICMFLWFSYPLGIIFSVLFVLVAWFSHKAQLRSLDS